MSFIKCNRQELFCIVICLQTDTNPAWYYVAIFASSNRKVTSRQLPGYPFQYPSGTRFFNYSKVRALHAGNWGCQSYRVMAEIRLLVTQRTWRENTEWSFHNVLRALPHHSTVHPLNTRMLVATVGLYLFIAGIFFVDDVTEQNYCKKISINFLQVRTVCRWCVCSCVRKLAEG